MLFLIITNVTFFRIWINLLRRSGRLQESYPIFLQPNYELLMITGVILRSWVSGVLYSVHVEEKEGEKDRRV
jgi:hypothetical protein